MSHGPQRPAETGLVPAAPDALPTGLTESDETAQEQRAQLRDARAVTRDRAAGDRDHRSEDALVGSRAAGDRAQAAADREAAASDRRSAADDRATAAQFRALMYRDELTGALQRRAGRDHLRREIDRAERSRSGLVVAFVDVDHLKEVNDTDGHAAGDRVLRAVAQALLHGLRSYDTVMRYGGDEFVCALLDASLSQARARMAAVQELLTTAEPGRRISIGLAQRQPAEGLDQVVARADAELYATRRSA